MSHSKRLTVSILAKDAEARLRELLMEVSWFADQIVVGVDSSSQDRTVDVAAALADIVFLFDGEGGAAGAATRIFDYADGDWILVLEDDERVEADFSDRVREMMAQPGVTHGWFTRKWLARAEPYEFLFAPSWYPDWKIRLFVNDRNMVWKPTRAHGGYHAMGPGLYEARSSILKVGPLLDSPEVREARLLKYGAERAVLDGESPHQSLNAVPRLPSTGPCPVQPRLQHKAPAVIMPQALAPTGSPDGTWDVRVMRVKMVSSAPRDQELVAMVTVRNTGSFTWAPSWGHRSASLFLSHHINDSNGVLVRWDRERTLILTYTPPGEVVTIIHRLHAPPLPGDYLIEWDMVSEGDRWFRVGSASRPFYSPLHVT